MRRHFFLEKTSLISTSITTSVLDSSWMTFSPSSVGLRISSTVTSCSFAPLLRKRGNEKLEMAMPLLVQEIEELTSNPASDNAGFNIYKSGLVWKTYRADAAALLLFVACHRQASQALSGAGPGNPANYANSAHPLNHRRSFPLHHIGLRNADYLYNCHGCFFGASDLRG